MHRTRKILVIISLLMLAACASIDVDTSAANFAEDKYAEDLNTCRGGTAAETMLSGLGSAAVGS
jgi:hypothetical protein